MIESMMPNRGYEGAQLPKISLFAAIANAIKSEDAKLVASPLAQRHREAHFQQLAEAIHIFRNDHHRLPTFEETKNLKFGKHQKTVSEICEVTLQDKTYGVKTYTGYTQNSLEIEYILRAHSIERYRELCKHNGSLLALKNQNFDAVRANSHWLESGSSPHANEFHLFRVIATLGLALFEHKPRFLSFVEKINPWLGDKLARYFYPVTWGRSNIMAENASDITLKNEFSDFLVNVGSAHVEGMGMRLQKLNFKEVCHVSGDGSFVLYPSEEESYEYFCKSLIEHRGPAKEFHDELALSEGEEATKKTLYTHAMNGEWSRFFKMYNEASRTFSHFESDMLNQVILNHAVSFSQSKPIQFVGFLKVWIDSGASNILRYDERKILENCVLSVGLALADANDTAVLDLQDLVNKASFLSTYLLAHSKEIHESLLQWGEDLIKERKTAIFFTLAASLMSSGICSRYLFGHSRSFQNALLREGSALIASEDVEGFAVFYETALKGNHVETYLFRHSNDFKTVISDTARKIGEEGRAADLSAFYSALSQHEVLSNYELERIKKYNSNHPIK